MGGGSADSLAPFEDAKSRGGGGGGGGDVSSSAMKKKVVVVMGATGAGKSRLAIDLASHFPAVEIVNADSMQVYRGLDVLTNKIPLDQRKGFPHHLLGTVDASVEFTSKDFRDLAVPIIDDILSRCGLPVIVGGTNYYIQALVSPFLVDDLVEDMQNCLLDARQDPNPINPTANYDCLEEIKPVAANDCDPVVPAANYDRLKEIDPVAANRIHPNDHRKINRYLNLYANLGVLPSDLFQGKAAEKWGRADNFRYNCCFIWVDASHSVLDKYVNERVDCMIEDGLLHEVFDVYHPNADYTRGLRQAIGVREFEDFFIEYFNSVAYQNLKENGSGHLAEAAFPSLRNKLNEASRLNFSEVINSDDSELKILLSEAIDRVKANTRKLVRRQKRRLNRLKTCFGWDIHYIDATEAISCNSGNSWLVKVVEPCIDIVKTLLLEEADPFSGTPTLGEVQILSMASRDLWVQYVCEACGNQILRGKHEWEQHIQGRGHRKRIYRLKKRLSALHIQQHHPTSKTSVEHSISNAPMSVNKSL